MERVFQRSLEGNDILVTKPECSWCVPIEPGDNSMICPTHRDELFVEVLERRMRMADIDQTRQNLVVYTVRNYLETLRELHHEGENIT